MKNIPFNLADLIFPKLITPDKETCLLFTEMTLETLQGDLLKITFNSGLLVRICVFVCVCVRVLL